MTGALVASSLSSCAHLASRKLSLSAISVVDHLAAGSTGKALWLVPLVTLIQLPLTVLVRVVLTVVQRTQQLASAQSMRHLYVLRLIDVIVADLDQRRVHGLVLGLLVDAALLRLELLQVSAARVILLTVWKLTLRLLGHLTRVIEVLHAHIVVAVFFGSCLARIAEWLAVA